MKYPVFPPPAISYEEFKKRWQQGFRTVEDLDPEFQKWLIAGFCLSLIALGVALIVR